MVTGVGTLGVTHKTCAICA